MGVQLEAPQCNVGYPSATLSHKCATRAHKKFSLVPKTHRVWSSGYKFTGVLDKSSQDQILFAKFSWIIPCASLCTPDRGSKVGSSGVARHGVTRGCVQVVSPRVSPRRHYNGVFVTLGPQIAYFWSILGVFFEKSYLDSLWCHPLTKFER